MSVAVHVMVYENGASGRSETVTLAALVDPARTAAETVRDTPNASDVQEMLRPENAGVLGSPLAERVQFRIPMFTDTVEIGDIVRLPRDSTNRPGVRYRSL